MKLTKEIYDEEMEKIKEVSRIFPWEEKSIYAHWLAQTTYYVLKSTRIVSLAGARFDEAHEALHRRCAQHIGEELGHEILSKNDLKHLGYQYTDFEELNSTKSMYQSQYYFIEHVHPISFFGYAIALEGIAVEAGDYVYERVSQAYGKEAAQFLKVHAFEDKKHIIDAFKAVEDIPPEEQEAVYKCFLYSVQMYSEILKELIALSQQKKEIAA